MGMEEVKLITSALKEMKKLTLLSIGDNSIGSDGAQEIASALKELKMLTTLHIRNKVNVYKF